MEPAFSLCTADGSAGREVCWFWQTEYIQSNYSAVFSSYVTTIGTRGRTNMKPQDPGEPKEPFGLVPHPFLLLHIPHPPPVFLCVSFSWTTPLLLSPLFLFLLFFHPPRPSSPLASSCSPPFPYLIPTTPLPLFSLRLIIWAPKSAISLQQPQLLPQTSLSCSVYSIIQAIWPLPLCRQPRPQRHIPEM